MKYPTPITAPALPQGAYEYLPQVRVFDEISNTDLEDAINDWLLGVVATPNLIVDVVRVDYDTYVMSQTPHHCALLHYTEITKI